MAGCFWPGYICKVKEIPIFNMFCNTPILKRDHKFESLKYGGRVDYYVSITGSGLNEVTTIYPGTIYILGQTGAVFLVKNKILLFRHNENAKRLLVLRVFGVTSQQ